MPKLKNSCPRLVSEEEVQLQIERLKRAVPTVDWEAVPRKKGSRLMTIDKTIRRFWERVDTTGDCWLWIGACNPQGYGLLRSRAVSFLAHRMSYVLTNGKIPCGLWVLHQCDTPACVNPNHLWIGTDLDNARDKQQKGRGNQPKGEANGRSKLSQTQVLEIVRRYENETARSLAEEFGVGIDTIFHIVSGRSWAWLTKNDRACITRCR